MNIIGGIYKIQSTIKPERIYIGSSINITQRWNHHLSDLRKNNHHSLKLQNHFRKYGIEDLEFSILVECDSGKLIELEQYFIDSYNPYFNNRFIAGSNLGCKHSDESKKKMSISQKGRFVSEESIQKRIKSMVGYVVSNETRKKMSESMMGKNTTKGRITSEEIKHKISEANKGKHFGAFSEDHKEKIRIAKAGKKLSEEHRLAIIDAKKNKPNWNKGKKGFMTGIIVSEETRKKRSESMKKNGIKPPSRKGMRMSEEDKQKRREANFKKKIKETKNELSAE